METHPHRSPDAATAPGVAWTGATRWIFGGAREHVDGFLSSSWGVPPARWMVYFTENPVCTYIKHQVNQLAMFEKNLTFDEVIGRISSQRLIEELPKSHLSK